MKAYGNRENRGTTYQQFGSPSDDDDFEMNDEWNEADYDENVSHASSRAHQTMVDSQRSTKIRNQLGRPTEDQPRENSSNRGASPYRVSAANYNYRVSNDITQGDGAYEDGEFLVVDQEVIIEEQYDPEAQKDFKSAYNQLVERVHLEQGNDLLLNFDELKSAQDRKELRKQLKDRTDDRIKGFNENKRRKVEIIKQENEKKEMDGCTFKPQLVAKPLKERRNFDQFIADQKSHEENKALKRNIMLEHDSQMEAGVIHHPAINESSRRMLQNRTDGDKPVYERLYGISKTNKKINQIINDADSDLQQESKFSTKPAKGGEENHETFAPKINQRSKEIVRDQPVQELLYNDALRRKDMDELRKAKILSKEQSKREKNINESNIEYLIHRFNKEFEPTFESIAQQGEDEPSDILNYRQLGELLFDMGFLSGSSSSESDERILLSSMWTGLGGAQNEGLNKEVIRAFLLAVEGVKITDSVKATTEEEFGQMKDGEFYPDCPKIGKHFRLMYLNRIRHSKDGTKRRALRIESEVNQDCTFQPIISDNTQSLALKYRQKIAENYQGGKISVLDILTAQTNKQQWIEETKKELENKESEECTFHPMTNENIQARPDESIEVTGDKCNDLYQISKVKQKNKIDKTKDEYEFEKASQECTFQPNTNKTSKARDANPHYVNQRSITENLERMKRAREEKDFKKKMTERGFGESSYVPQPKKVVNKPTNYQVRVAKKTTKASVKATDGSSRVSRQKKEETKSYAKAQKLDKERRSPGMRNAVKGTVSSQNKKRATPTYNPLPQEQQQVKRNNQVRAYEHPEYEQMQEPEQIYDSVEQDEEEIRHHLGHDDEPLIEDEQQTPEDQYIEHQDIGRYAEPQDSPEQEELELELELEQQQQDDDQQPNELPEAEGEDGPNPLLFVDVNLGPGRAERIVVYEGDTAEQLADEFTTKHGLDENLKDKLVKLLENQIAGLLARIDEELTSNGTENEQ
jgi:hypothetical protein